MRIYAERPGRAALQVLTDVAVLAWALLVVELAGTVHDAVLGLQAPAQRLTGAGDSIRGAFDGAARTASGVPFVGDDLARALGTGTDAGDSLATSGRDLAASVASAATGVSAAILLVGLVPVVVAWLALRARWVHAARSARLARAAGPDLLALHALTRRPTRALLRVTPHPAAAWRHGDPAVVAALAELELAALGLRGSGERRADAGVSP
jgi:hypothetical protein